MRDGFGTVIASLWASLGLGEPRIAEDAASLRIDRRTVRLALGPDREHLLITTEIGALADEPLRREEQTRKLLHDGLGLILTNRAGLQLGTGRAAGRVQAVALAACRASEVPRLRELIEDVLHLADIHAATLASGDRVRGTPRRPEPIDTGESLIFRL